MAKDCKKTSLELAAFAANPSILSSNRYSENQMSACKNTSVLRRKRNDKENSVLEHPRVASTGKKKVQEIANQIEQKNEIVRKSHLPTKNIEEQLSDQIVQKSESVLKKFKQIIRKKENAAKDSKVLQDRKKQLKIEEDYNKVVEEDETIDSQTYQDNFSSFLVGDILGAKDQREGQLPQAIQENGIYMTEKRRPRVKQQPKERDWRELRVQIEKERYQLENRKEMQRQHALEAMLMAENRRLREEMEEHIDDRICSLNNTGKRSTETKKVPSVQRARGDHGQQLQARTEYMHQMHMERMREKKMEEGRIERHVDNMRLKFTAEEKQKLRRDRALKKARIEQHLAIQQRQRAKKLRQEELQHFEKALRLKYAQATSKFQLELQVQENIAPNVRPIDDMLPQMLAKITIGRNAPAQININSTTHSGKTLAVQKLEVSIDKCPVVKRIPSKNFRGEKGVTSKPCTKIKYDINYLKALCPYADKHGNDYKPGFGI